MESFPPRRAGPPRRTRGSFGLVIQGHGDTMWQRTWWQQVAAMAMASARWSPFVKHDHGKREDFDAVFFGGAMFISTVVIAVGFRSLLRFGCYGGGGGGGCGLWWGTSILQWIGH